MAPPFVGQVIRRMDAECTFRCGGIWLNIKTTVILLSVHTMEFELSLNVDYVRTTVRPKC